MPCSKDFENLRAKEPDRYKRIKEELRESGSLRLLSYLEAIEKGSLTDYYLTLFLSYRDDYSGDLPQKDVRKLIEINENGEFNTRTGRGTAFKCQGNYIVGLALALQKAIDDSVIINPSTLESVEGFLDHDFNYIDGRFTSPEEIDLINHTLDQVIEDIGQQLGVSED